MSPNAAAVLSAVWGSMPPYMRNVGTSAGRITLTSGFPGLEKIWPSALGLSWSTRSHSPKKKRWPVMGAVQVPGAPLPYPFCSTREQLAMGMVVPEQPGPNCVGPVQLGPNWVMSQRGGKFVHWQRGSVGDWDTGGQIRGSGCVVALALHVSGSGRVVG